MAIRYTQEQLNIIDKSLLITMFLGLQEQVETLTKEVSSLDNRIQLMAEQLLLANQARFGRPFEKMSTDFPIMELPDCTLLQSH